MTKQAADTFKGIAILQVVIIHICSVLKPEWWARQDLISFSLIALDQFNRIALPVFFFLSWYGLAKKHEDSHFNAGQFLVSRINKLLPLYLLWSLGIIILTHFVTAWRFSPQIPIQLKLLLGQADYQLYFVPVFIFLYGVYCVVRQFPKWLLIVCTISLVAITLWWYRIPPNSGWPFRSEHFYQDQLQYLNPLSWLWFAWLGLIAARFNVVKILENRKLLLSVAALTFLGLIIATRDAYLAIDFDKFNVLFALRYTRWAIWFYATCGLILMIGLAKYASGRKTRWLQIIGINSYLIYLAHTLLIRLILTQFVAPLSLGLWLVGAIGIGLLVFISLWKFRKSG